MLDEYSISISLYFFFLSYSSLFLLFFFNATATTEIYTLSLHDALPIYQGMGIVDDDVARVRDATDLVALAGEHLADRKSTRLNSSHITISYAVFCLKKKNKRIEEINEIHNNIKKRTNSCK